MMGSKFELVAISQDEAKNSKAIEEAIHEIVRIENLISSWKPESETSKINQQAGKLPVQVTDELYHLVERSIKISDLTQGAFDISFKSLDPIWIFDGREMDHLDSAMVNASIHKINYRNIKLNEQDRTIFLKDPGMKIGFGAIGKGYAANRGKKVMQDYGISDGLINAGGDLIAWGNQVNGEPWQVGIADPGKRNKYIAWLNVTDMSVVTSGNYEKYVIIGGKKYGHIINPKTGYPVSGIQSVTIVSPDAELSDGLATSVFVMGVPKGLDLVNRLKDVECLIVDDQNKIWTSDQLELNYY